MNGVPYVSVIIPAYYSYRTIEACLQALRIQRFRDFETIVVNSSPEDRTQEIMTERFPEVIFEQSPTRLFPHAARNRGATLAHGRLLVSTDPDCVANPSWLACLVDRHQAGYPVVGGSMDVVDGNWFEYGIHLCKFFWALPGLSPGSRWILPTANLCYSREVWNAVGPMDTCFVGDAVFSWRAVAQGYLPWFEPNAVVKHHHDGTMGSFWHERLSRGHEFAEVRMVFERWSRLRATLYLFIWPLLVPLVLVRAGRDSLRAGWGWRYLWTLPIQFLGHLAWSLGEAYSHGRCLICGMPEEEDI
jgi:O-antigen biosynthesis protein